MVDQNVLADLVLASYVPTFAEALAVPGSADDDRLPVLHAAFRLRRRRCAHVAAFDH